MSSSLPSLFWLPFLHQHLRVQSYTQVYHSSHKPHSALAFQHPSVKGGFWWSQSCLLVGHWYPCVASRCILLTVGLLERGWSSELPSWVIWCKKLPENVSWTTYCSKKSCFMCLIRLIEVLGSVWKHLQKYTVLSDGQAVFWSQIRVVHISVPLHIKSQVSSKCFCVLQSAWRLPFMTLILCGMIRSWIPFPWSNGLLPSDASCLNF